MNGDTYYISSRGALLCVDDNSCIFAAAQSLMLARTIPMYTTHTLRSPSLDMALLIWCAVWVAALLMGHRDYIWRGIRSGMLRRWYGNKLICHCKQVNCTCPVALQPHGHCMTHMAMHKASCWFVHNCQSSRFNWEWALMHTNGTVHGVCALVFMHAVSFSRAIRHQPLSDLTH